jgi:autotransporter-associated beta strand protein
MTISGVGIVNNSSTTQTFTSAFLDGGYTMANSATTGTTAFQLSNGGVLVLRNSSNAGTSNVTVVGGGSRILLFDSASLASATVSLVNGGFIPFVDSSSGGTANVTLSGAASNIDLTGLTTAGTTIGSVAGASGQVLLGTKQFVVGGSNASTTFGGIISDTGGAGSIVKAGSGIWTLTGANTYGGGTTVTAGTLQLGTGGSLASTGALTVNGGTFDLNGNVQTVGALSGSGGAITLGSGTLTTNSASSTTLASTIMGTGALVKQGAGTLTLTGNSSYSGGTTVLGGLVNLATAGNFGTGPITLNGGGLQWASGSTTDISPRLAALGTAGGRLDTNGNTVTLASAITGTGGFTKVGQGTLILTGTNSYSGGTTVSAGVLQGTTSGLQGNIVNNAMVAFNQGSSGTYAGGMSGTGGVSIASGGIVRFTGTNSYTGPTTVTGSGLVVNGGLAQNGGAFSAEVNAQGQGDRVNVNGAATINGGTVQLVAMPGTYGIRTTYTILNATAGVSGVYSGGAGNFGFLTPSLSYTANSVLLTLALQGNAFSSLLNATRNQRAIGAALDQSYSTATGNFATAIGALASLSIQQAGPALTAISGQPYTDTSTAAIAASQLILNTVEQQITAAHGQGSQPGTRVALAQACDVACDGEVVPSRLSAWMSGAGGFGSVGGGTNADTLTYNVGGAAAGIDWRLDPRFLLGAAISYTGGRQWVGDLNGSANDDNYTGMFYASFTQGGFYADAMAGYAYADTQVQRVVTIPGLQTATANGRVGISQFLGQVEMDYGIGV